MRELEAIEVTTSALEPGCEQTLLIGQPHPEPILLSHFEVTALVPAPSIAALTDLRIDQVCYLMTPVSLSLIQREQHHAEKRAKRETHQLLTELIGSVPSPQLLRRFKPNRRELRQAVLDIGWKPGQQLVVTFKNCGPSVIGKISIELVLYARDLFLPAAN